MIFTRAWSEQPACAASHKAAGAPDMLEGGPQKVLSEREIHYLRQIAGGRTVHEIATSDGIPVTTIADALNSAIAKLEATNLMDAVLKAVKLEILPGNDNMPRPAEGGP